MKETVDKLKIEDVIAYIYKLLYDEHNRHPSMVRVIKLAYITEYYYYRKYGERMTDVEWVNCLYGPHLCKYCSVSNCDNRLDEPINLGGDS
jgi:hypothetical protein